MELPTPTLLRIGRWRVDTRSGQISRNGETARLESRTLRLLLCLAEHAGEVVSIDDLLYHVWSGVTVSPDSVYQAVASLRRVLGDDPKQPAFIATVPRLGYRMVAQVRPWAEEPNPASPTANQRESAREVAGETQAPAPTPARRPFIRRAVARAVAAASIVLAVVLGAIFMLHGKVVPANAHSASADLPQPPQRSIMVLPFLDLTQGMKEEEFADGMTEELIDKISRLSGFTVPSPTSSFFYKGKQIPVAEIANALGVAYVLDGSVRKSGDRVRVAARLIRADSGYLIWSETYDRPFHDILMVQDDIASEVTKTLKTSIGAPSGQK
jgi:transcriptional activator of cad operon